jgi:hypothetical protein
VQFASWIFSRKNFRSAHRHYTPQNNSTKADPNHSVHNLPFPRA